VVWGLQILAVTSGANPWPGATRAAWAAGVITAAQAAAPVNTVATRKALFIEQSFPDADGRHGQCGARTVAIMLSGGRGI
jgi:hypothetical protein